MNERHFAEEFRTWNRRWPPGIQFALSWRSLYLLIVSLRTVLLLWIDGCGRCLDLLSRQLVCLDVFSVFPWRCPVLFRLGSLVGLCRCDWWTLLVGQCLLVMWSSRIFIFWTVSSVSAHGGLHADTLSCSFESFSFFSLCTVFGTTNCETSGTPEFFEFVREQFLFLFILFLCWQLLFYVCWEPLFYFYADSRRSSQRSGRNVEATRSRLFLCLFYLCRKPYVELKLPVSFQVVQRDFHLPLSAVTGSWIFSTPSIDFWFHLHVFGFSDVSGTLFGVFCMCGPVWTTCFCCFCVPVCQCLDVCAY